MLAGWTRCSRDIGRIAASSATAIPPTKMTGKNVKRGVHRSVKISLSNPCRPPPARWQNPVLSRPRQEPQLRRRRILATSTGRAQSFHEGKVTAAVGYPSGQSGKHAYRGSQNDQNRSHEKRGSHLAQHPSFALHDLAHRADVRAGQSLRELLHRRTISFDAC